MRKLPRFIPIVATFAVAVSACASDKQSTPKTDASNATSTSAATASIKELAALYQGPGPFPVGVTTTKLPKGNKVEIWYPAVKGSAGKESYDIRDFVSPAIKALLTADVPAAITYDATRDAAVADGKFPVVLFSHGFSGMRLQSTALTSHLASWGMIVTSADHPSRDLYHLLGDKPADDSAAELLAELDLVTTMGSKEGSLLLDHVDADRVAAMGHSAGGGTIVRAAQQSDKIDGYVSLASGLFGSAASTDPDCLAGRASTTTVAGATTTTPPAPPTQPSIFIGGANDAIAIPKCVTVPAFKSAPTPTRLWLIDKVGHNGFDDFCRVGNGAGIIGVAEASGLGPALSQGSLVFAKKLGEDGCKAPNVPVTQAYPIINHVTTAWLRNLFGIDEKPLGLDASVAKEFSLSVQIEERLG